MVRPKAKNSSLLEKYVDHFGSGENHYNILRRFCDANRKFSDKTEKDYTRDIYKFLTVKFFNYWDFKKKFANIAGNLALIHILDEADKEIMNKELDLDEGEEVLEEIIIRTEQEKFLPYNLRKKNKMLPLKALDGKKSGKTNLAQRLLGEHFQLYENNGNVVMRLRPEDPGDLVFPLIEIDYRERTMLEFVLAHYDGVIDEDFWPDIYTEEKIGQVLRWIEKNGRIKKKKTGNTKNTIARKMAALDRFERFLKKKNLVRDRIMPDMDRPTKVDKLQIYLNEGDFRRVYRYLDELCEKTSAKDSLLRKRDRAMIGLLHITCARGSAIVKAEMGELDLDNNQLYIREKGRAENIVPIEGSPLRYLKQFLKVRNEFMAKYNVRVENREYIFHNRLGTLMSRRSLSRNINRIFTQAGVRKKVGKKKAIGTHVIRRSAADALDKAQAPIHHLQKLMNHRHTSTTERYLSLGPIDLKKTVRKYHPFAK
jgi:integrase/recombinase XerC